VALSRRSETSGAGRIGRSRAEPGSTGRGRSAAGPRILGATPPVPDGNPDLPPPYLFTIETEGVSGRPIESGFGGTTMDHHALVASMLAVIVAGVASAGDGTERVLRKEITIRAPLEKVWRAWTTVEGLAPVSGTSNVELRVGGAYEWFLDGEPDENGLRGGQGSRVLAFLPGEVLAFDWTFPPSVPSLRASRAKTQVVVQFDEPETGVVRIRFAQLGWGQGEDWDRGYDYFDKAWDWVLQTMKESLEG
jgi:uncharacterized protein YndB with AHSA1/START domain